MDSLTQTRARGIDGKDRFTAQFISEFTSEFVRRRKAGEDLRTRCTELNDDFLRRYEGYPHIQSYIKGTIIAVYSLCKALTAH